MRVFANARWKDIQSKVKNAEGKKPKSEHCVMQRVHASGRKGAAVTKCKNCGRKKTPEEEKKIVQYVQKWKSKLFCICARIKKELKLDVSRLTISSH